MTVPVLTFFNNKSGVGKTALVYLNQWRQDWQRRRNHWTQPDFPLL